ncbi:DUF6634 family protein [Pelagibius sp. CAU 1746]|uniref:DUF6634 family protein n=1 Tax=Pelagibius sp. CAU 1746 TaxID=3140370 RepID=UPI00325B4B89
MTEQKSLLEKIRKAQAALERLERGEGPTEEDLTRAPLLDYWCVVAEGRFVLLQGLVTGHPKLVDGDFIQTSALLWLAPDRTSARTLSRFYRLGVPWEDLLNTRQ